MERNNRKKLWKLAEIPHILEEMTRPKNLFTDDWLWMEHVKTLKTVTFLFNGRML